MDGPDLRETGDRIAELLAVLERSLDVRGWQQVQDVVRLVTDLYGGGLARILELSGEDPDLRRRMAEDDLVASLLVLHGLHPLALADRVQRAVESVRPYLATHGGGVEVLDIDEDSGGVTVRMLGSCEGCASSSVTLELAVQRAIEEAAPEITRIAVDGATSGVETLVSLGRKPTAAPATAPIDGPRAGERCDMCAEPVADEHDHVADAESRSLLCTCRSCWLLFTSGASGGKYRAVPDRYVSLGALSIAPGAWDELQIPVSVAFFFRNSNLGSVAAFYPSPAGATESLLPLDAWERLVADNAVLGTLAPDVEALLVRRDATHEEAYLVPIDACYELVGELRRLWKGFDGGSEAHQAMDGFFDRVRLRSTA